MYLKSTVIQSPPEMVGTGAWRRRKARQAAPQTDALFSSHAQGLLSPNHNSRVSALWLISVLLQFLLSRVLVLLLTVPSQCIYKRIRSNSPQSQRWSRVEANVFNPALTPYFLVLTHSSHGSNIGRTRTVYFLMASWKLKYPRLATQEGRPGWRHPICLHFLDCLPEDTLVAEYDTLGWLAYNLIG